MIGGITRVTPDKEKAKSIMKMVETTLEMIETIDTDRFPSNIIKEYYDTTRELMTTVLLLDGFKTHGEGAHKRLIDYLDENYGQFTEHEISLLDELRNTRNRISYNGFFITEDYLRRKRSDILNIISKLENIINKKLGEK
jgi:hypothetical protein